MLVTILLLALLAVAAGTDLTRHKIYNATTYPGMLAGLMVHGLGSAYAAFSPDSAETLARWGCVPLYASLAGWAICGFVMVACYVLFRKVGGGDVKLMAMIGALLGYEQGLMVMLWTFVFGACAGLMVLVWRVGPWSLTVRLLRQVKFIARIGGWGPLTDEERQQLQAPLFLAPCAFLAGVMVRFELERYVPLF